MWMFLLFTYIRQKGPVAGVITLFLLLPLLTFEMSCGGGGGGGGSSHSTGGQQYDPVSLLSITFPDKVNLSGATTIPPQSAPLSQQIVFTFSGVPAEPISSSSIAIYAAVGNDYAGPESVLDQDNNVVPARGDFEVFDNIVVFTPDLPLRDIDFSLNALPEEVPGLLPAEILGVGVPYTIYIPLGTSASIPNLEWIHPDVQNPTYFMTGDIANLYFSNFFTLPPSLEETSPPDGETDVSVNTITPVTGLPGFEEFHISFDQPLDAGRDNIEGTDFDGDGVRDPNIFLRCSDPLLFAALSGSVQDGLFRLDRDDPGTFLADTFHQTTYLGFPLSLIDIVVTRQGTLLGLAGGNLFRADPSTGELTERVDLALPGLKGLAVSPDGFVYSADSSTGILYRLTPPGYSVEAVGTLSDPATIADLAYGYDDMLYLLRLDYSGGPPQSFIDLVDPSNGTAVPLLGGYNNAFASLTFISNDTLCLFEEGTFILWEMDVTSGALVQKGIGPFTSPGEVLDLATLFYNMDVEPILLENGTDGSLLSINPCGVLPFDTRIEILVRNRLRNIRFGSLASEENAKPEGARCAAVFRTLDPGLYGINEVDDVFIEDYDDNEYESSDLDMNHAPATWNIKDQDPGEPPYVDNLLASFGLGGSGNLGDFLPQGIFPIVMLDTDYQRFPLYDGSTPDIKEPLSVTGGKFHFRNIVIPVGVTVVGRGSNPLVLTATGDVNIGGTIDVSGMKGHHDITFDSGFTPVFGGKGGPGGGRGGMSQPSIPEDFRSLKDLITPAFAEQGWGYSDLNQVGGRGGETGADSTDIKMNGNSPDKYSRGAGAGGGSFLTIGDPGREGMGRYGVMEDGTPYIRDGNAPPSGGLPGDPVFTDGNPDNDFFGGVGELQTLIGGMGGGGGGTRWDSLNPASQGAVQGTMYPPCLYDAKGGGGGGGSGSVAIHAMGSIVLTYESKILAIGGAGAGGEQVGAANFGGASGGGSGGAIILHSGVGITLEGYYLGQAAEVNVSGGTPGDAKEKTKSATAIGKGFCNPLPPKQYPQFCSYSEGDGGQGGYGVIQLQVDDPANKITIHPDSFVGATIVEVDWGNLSPKGFDLYKFTYVTDPVVDPYKTVATLSSKSYGLSKWIDMGLTIRRPAIQVGPDLINPPVFLGFEGTDSLTGTVITEASGYVKNSGIPDFNDIEVDSPDLLIADYIASDNDVIVEFQGAMAAVPGSAVPGKPYSAWTADITSLSGYQFVRYRINLDVSKSGNPTIYSTRPQVNLTRLRMRY